MSLMSLLRVSFFFFSSFAVAQVSAPNCISPASPTWQWAYNSIGQSPCTVLANLMSTCSGGQFTLMPLLPNYTYPDPTSTAANLCYCSTVGYSLFSACALCQEGQWTDWSTWVTNCTRTMPPTSFPNPVPSGIWVPQWAHVNITIWNYWSPNTSFQVGDSPEFGPGSIIGPSNASVTSSSKASSTGLPTPPPSNGSSVNSAAIAGGVVGSIVGVSIVLMAIFYLRRRSRARAAASADASASQPQQPQSDEVAPLSSSEPPIMKFYDPDDPTTFPGYQGGPDSQDVPSQVPTSSNIGTRNTLANTQTSLPQASGYHGLPTV
ncbi:hypothetical protein DFH94DRAFT_354215 [Russula ochroleuca]|uniref:Transmembrane protein n=1 Tax=Russula ochroleuca TaxID=152965 RepID=A0A9P5JW60_9AGAM|nr:hypothetical protein DFH94DRAFT_354215 [Russula ochroleuca]